MLRSPPCFLRSYFISPYFHIPPYFIFLALFLIELLYAFGSRPSTIITLLHPNGHLKGSVKLGAESDPRYYNDFISIGAHHWRDVTRSHKLSDVSL